jgi:hypothetical protein
MVSLQTDSTTTQTLVNPQSPQRNVRVSVEVPVDSVGDGQEVTVVVSPKKPTHITDAPAYSEIEVISFNTMQSNVHPLAVINPNTTASNPTHSTIVYDSEEEDVFSVRVANRNEAGRKEKRWYVIMGGRKVGIFYKFWYVALIF